MIGALAGARWRVDDQIVQLTPRRRVQQLDRKRCRMARVARVHLMPWHAPAG